MTAEPLGNPPAASLDRLNAVRAAIVGYALQIVAMQDADPERITDARRALAPIDERRAREARRTTATPRAGGAADPTLPEEDPSVTPTTPVPTVEADEAAAIIGR